LVETSVITFAGVLPSPTRDNTSASAKVPMMTGTNVMPVSSMRFPKV